jgi:reticulon-4-interacting protein 1, mitochondrial
MLHPSLSIKSLIYGHEGTVQCKIRSLSPRIPKNHVLVKVFAAGLNPVDAKEVIGDKLPTWLKFLSSSIVRGCIIGFEFSGQVVAISKESNLDNLPQYDVSFQHGDKVFGTLPPFEGTLSEYVFAPIDQIHHMPSNLSYEEAAGLPLVGLTALQALSPYTPTDSSAALKIIGASGGVGHVALQVARELGWNIRVAVCSTPNVDYCQALGATHVVDYSRPNSFDDTTLPSEWDIILDCVTSADSRDRIHQYPDRFRNQCRTKYLRLGGPTLDWFYAGCERVIPYVTCFHGKEKLFWIRFPNSSNDLKLLATWCREEKLKPTISQIIPFAPDAVQEALDTILSRRVKGKIVVQIAEEST